MGKVQAFVEVCDHLVTHDWHGYSQPGRYGDGSAEVVPTCIGDVTIATGDRDCTSMAQTAMEAVGLPTGGFYYTGNADVLGTVGWVALDPYGERLPGDVLVYHRGGSNGHMAVANFGGGLDEFYLSEHGTIDGDPGDQTGLESRQSAWYDPGWDCLWRWPEQAEAAPQDVPGDVYAGADRYATCAAIADALRPGATPVTAGGDRWPDVAGVLWAAGALKAAVRLASGQPTIGGIGFSGPDRNDTAKALRWVARGMGAVPSGRGCFVVGWDCYADAAAVAEPSYRLGWPILFQGADTSCYDEVVAVGGTGTLAGADRGETCALAAERYATDWSRVWIASGSAATDGLAAAQRGDGTPLLFAEGQAIIDALKRHAGEVHAVSWVGGMQGVGRERRMEICAACGLA